jgi:hypothetical protein
MPLACLRSNMLCRQAHTLASPPKGTLTDFASSSSPLAFPMTGAGKSPQQIQSITSGRNGFLQNCLRRASRIKPRCGALLSHPLQPLVPAAAAGPMVMPWTSHQVDRALTCGQHVVSKAVDIRNENFQVPVMSMGGTVPPVCSPQTDGASSPTYLQTDIFAHM